MANPLLGLSFITPTGVTATQEATGHPVSNLLVADKWRRTWRTTAATNGLTCIIDFGATTLLSGFFLNGGNFSSVKAAGSANLSTWVELYAAPTAFALEDRVRQARHKAWFPAAGWQNVFNHRYLRVECHSVDAPSPGYFELGSIAFPTPAALVTMVQGWSTPYTWTPVEPHTPLPYAGGGREINIEGPEVLRFELAGGPWRTSALTQLLSLRKLGLDGPLFYYENRGNLAHAYLLKRLEDVTFGERVPTFDASWQFVETS